MLPDKEGKSAITHYQVLRQAKEKDICWIELTPETGRTHQLRVHCNSIGCPILGDGKYGGQTAQPFLKRIPMHLHAHYMEIPYPHGEVKKIQAPLPQHMLLTFKKLGFPVLVPPSSKTGFL